MFDLEEDVAQQSACALTTAAKDNGSGTKWSNYLSNLPVPAAALVFRALAGSLEVPFASFRNWPYSQNVAGAGELP
jgi:hypothetical protein